MARNTSWTLLSKYKIEKELDISSFRHRGSAIPKEFYSFFNIKNQSQVNNNNRTLFDIIFINKERRFENNKMKILKGDNNSQRGYHIRWRLDFIKFLKDSFPRWRTIKANADDPSGMKLILTKTQKSNMYEVECVDVNRKFYWVNQGNTWTVEREQGILWAPVLNKRKTKQPDWELLKDMTPGDIVFSYTKQNKSIRAISMVTNKFRYLNRPRNFGEKTTWMKKGRAVDVHYVDIIPMKLDKVFKNKICKYQKYFNNTKFILNKNLNIKEQYLFQLPYELGSFFLNQVPQEHIDELPEIKDFPLVIPQVKKSKKSNSDTNNEDQRYGIPKHNRIVEQYAMNFVKKIIVDKGFDVEDVSTKRLPGNKSYGCDFIFTKGKKKIYAEVKGTRTDGKKVMITRNEFKQSKEYGSNSELYIVHNISLDLGTKPPKASGGKLKVLKPWKPNAKNLDPITYDFDVSKN
tara:strand:- start:47 stop:1429 length:1383 start_codon:yes stop_codon:yes gene_type:complete